MPPPRAWIRHRREDLFPSMLKMSEPTAQIPMGKIKLQITQLPSSGKGKGKKKKSYVNVLIYAKAKPLNS